VIVDIQINVAELLRKGSCGTKLSRPPIALGFSHHCVNIRLVDPIQEFVTKPMSHHTSSMPCSSRFTLKLKPGTRKSPREAKTPPPRPQSKLRQKPAAAWSDELKQYS
jgi:hypothetical protein